MHVVRAPIAVGAAVHGEIDWARRFDHMQQHTGQHVLSAAFDRLLDNRTMSFHMGGESSTIDLAREVSSAEVERCVDEANRVVWEDRPVTIRFASPEEAARLPLRKEPVREGTAPADRGQRVRSVRLRRHARRPHRRDRRHCGDRLGEVQGRHASHVRVRRPRGPCAACVSRRGGRERPLAVGAAARAARGSGADAGRGQAGAQDDRAACSPSWPSTKRRG